MCVSMALSFPRCGNCAFGNSAPISHSRFQLVTQRAKYNPHFTFLLPSSRYHAAFQALVREATAEFQKVRSAARTQRSAAASQALAELQGLKAAEATAAEAAEAASKAKEDAPASSPDEKHPRSLSPLSRRCLARARKRAARVAWKSYVAPNLRSSASGVGGRAVLSLDGHGVQGYEPDSDLDLDVELHPKFRVSA